MARTTGRHLAPTIYSLAVGLAGWGVLLVFCPHESVPWSSLLFFVLLSTLTKQLGFQVVENVTHSLVGVVDLAALFSLGPWGGGLVSAGSAALCQFLWSKDERRTIEHARRPSAADLRPHNPWLLAWFGSGLNAIMTLVAGRVYGALGGSIPMRTVSWAVVLAAVSACLAWFVLDHLGWALRAFLAGGYRRALRFLQAVLPYSLSIELLPLPSAVLISAAYLSLDAPLLVLMMLAILGVDLVLRRLMISLSDERRYVRHLLAISEVSRQVASIPHLQDLFTNTVKLVKSTFGYYHVSIFTVDVARHEVTFQASSSPMIQRRGVLVPWGMGIIGHAASSGDSALANDVLHDPRFLRDSGLEQTRSELAVPLKVDTAATGGGRVVGVLDVQSDRRGAFGQQDALVLRSLADQIALGIEDKRLYEAQQEQTWVSTALLQVADAIGKLNTSQEILETVLRLVPMLTGVERCLVFLWSEEERTFVTMRSTGFSPEQTRALENQRFAGQSIPLLEQVRQGGRVVHDSSEQLLAFMPPPLWDDRLRQGQLWALPLRTKGEVTGILVAEDLGGDDHLAAHRQTILTGIAHHTAMALENARLYALQREEAWLSTALLQVANMTSLNRDLHEIITATVRMTSLLVGLPWCGILLWDEEHLVFSGSHAYGLPALGLEFFEGRHFDPAAFPLLQQVMAGEEPVMADDGQQVMPPSALGSLGRSLIASPLRIHGRMLGVLLAGGMRDAHALASRRVDLLMGIAVQASVAIEAARLYQQTVQQQRLQREIELARSIQESFLPACCPRIPGWQLATEWRAARGVGGDYFDYIPLDTDHLGLVIADVADKGVAAALYMALTRAVMRTIILDNLPPAETLRRVNHLLLDDSRSGMFVSMFYGILDLGSGEFSYARAGHNPPLLVRAADHSLSPLNPRGVVLGVVENPDLAEDRVTLSPGDVLVMYTDGLTEAMGDEQEEFGEERLQRLLVSASECSADLLASRISTALRAFVGEQPQNDDLTLMVLKRGDGVPVFGSE